MKWWRNRSILFEVGTVLVIAQGLAGDGFLQRRGNAYGEQYRRIGYVLPERIVIEEVMTGDDSLSGLHAGGWSPGRIGLRAHPKGIFGPEQYLAHELAHEAVFRTCGAIPEWKSEALAMVLSGELTQPGELESSASENALHDRKRLWEIVRDDRPLEPGAVRALRRVLRPYASQQQRVCHLPAEAERELRGPTQEDGPRWIAVSLSSQRTLATGGDTTNPIAPGSLLKLLYVASDRSALSPAQVQGLLHSDEEAIRASSLFDADRFVILSAPLRWSDQQGTGRERSATPVQSAVAMGHPDAYSYPYHGSLDAVARAVRNAILLKGRSSWSGLALFDEDPRATITSASGSVRDRLRQMSAWTKTGTTSLHDGTPIEGVMAIVWPANDPTVLLVAARRGVRGAQVWNGREEELAAVLSKLGPFNRDSIAEVFSLLPRQSYSIQAPLGNRACELLRLDDGGTTSTCGAVELITTAAGAVPRRYVHGVVAYQNNALVLRTDPFTYGEYVVQGEGGGMSLPVREAIQAVGAWNSAFGNHGHTAGTVCDTTHCMVQKGTQAQNIEPLSPAQLQRFGTMFSALQRLGSQRAEPWFEFSYAIPQQWRRVVTVDDIAARCGVAALRAVVRQRDKRGVVSVVLRGDDYSSVVTGDSFMVKLDLPSCPTVIESRGGVVVLSGDLVGHGRGMSIWDWNQRCLVEHCTGEGIILRSYG